jgi:cell division septation protein DedD
MRFQLSSAVLAGALMVAVPVSAQSLGELAKREAERKKSKPTATKTYTNGDLKSVAPPSGAATGDPLAKDGKEAKEQDAKDAKVSKEPEKVDATKPAEPAKDEAYWRGRMAAAREDVRRNEAFKEAMQTRINALTADFTARDDPYQRAKIADDRQKALAELARLTEDIDKGNKLIVDIEEEARRAGVPPGWIR